MKINQHHKIRELTDLQTELAKNKVFSYLLFWGHTNNESGDIGKSCLSQWYPAAFTINEITYPTAEHFMMAEKARIFGDTKVLEKILLEQGPANAKKLGRIVSGYDEVTWRQQRYDIIVQGNMAKFSQNQQLMRYLVEIQEDIIVEASPYDKVWGIGLAQAHSDSKNPFKWKGLNLLGFALMDVRDELRKQG